MVRLLALGLWLVGPGIVEGAEARRDILRKNLAFYEMTVPTANGEVRFALTLFDVNEREFYFNVDRPRGVTYSDEQARAHLRRELLLVVRDWWENHLSGGNPGSLAPGMLESLRTDHSLFRGHNTVLALSEPDDFDRISALVRVAKPTLLEPELPFERQFRNMLEPLPATPFVPVPENKVLFYSFRHPEPHGMLVQNATVYSGDIVELKHYGAVFRKDVDLTALLFHAGQELGVFSISRLEEGSYLGLPPGPALITPSLFVAESDHPHVVQLLVDGAKFRVHQTVPGAIHAAKETKVLVGNPADLGKGLMAVHGSRRNAWQLPDVKITPREDGPFLQSLLGPHRCSARIVGALERLDRAAREKLREAVRKANP